MRRGRIDVKQATDEDGGGKGRNVKKATKRDEELARLENKRGRRDVNGAKDEDEIKREEGCQKYDG